MKRSPIQVLVSMCSSGHDFDKMRGIPRDPVEGGGAIVCQLYDESRLWNACVVAVNINVFVVVISRLKARVEAWSG